MQMNALDPSGPQAARIATLAWAMIAVASVVWALVVITLGLSLKRSHRRHAADASDETNHRMQKPVAIATAITVLILVGSLVWSVWTGDALASLPQDKALRIEIRGRQWWWEAEYVDPQAGNRLTVANEIHIPVGEPVQIIGTSADVIHSFWVPELAGKKDLIPGHATTMWLKADKPGIYRGQCAEFCGHQHAKMAVLVFAESRDEFNKWYKAQMLPAPPPPDSLSRVGERVFMSKGCPLCHTVGGTLALGRIGPPLTHIGSSFTLAAGTLKNTPGNMGGWIVDPQRIKPGAKMPPQDLSGSELQALLTYLGNLR